MDERWWGWGTLDRSYPLEDRPGFWPFLRERLGLRGDERSPVVDLAQIELPAPRIPPQALDGLRDLVGAENVSISKMNRLTHALGKSYRDLVRLRRGEVENPPDAVVWPREEEQVADLLRLAQQWKLAVIPFGGGTSVVGGVEPTEAEGLEGTISLDLKGLNRVLAVDRVSLTATVQAGILGPELERALNDQGYTLGHFPQSFEFSTLGGWIATRAAGHASTKYGKIEQMVVSLRVVAPVGVIETKAAPASASGPDLKGLLIGSEGVYGVITRATLRIHPLPEVRDYRGLLFRSFGDGVQAVREMMQAELFPATVRLSDAGETRAYMAMRRVPTTRMKALKERVGTWLLARRGYSLEDGCLMILGLEGDRETVAREREAALAICRAHGGFHLGRSVGRAWHAERFELPYLRDILLDHGVMVDTLETATTWENLESLYARVRDALWEAIEATGVQPWVMAHLSHAYPDGASLYYTFLGRQVPGHEIEQWWAIKRAATDCIMAHGGTLSHHHGVGLDHAPWLEAEHGPEGVRALRALKRALDPEGIMNPGKLLPVHSPSPQPSPPGERGWGEGRTR